MASMVLDPSRASPLNLRATFSMATGAAGLYESALSFQRAPRALYLP